MSDNNFEKILFRCFSNDLQEIVVETLWAKCINREKGLYKLDNIPFYDLPCSCDDIIFAEYDNDEERITFRKVVEPSGNSTILVIVNDENIKEELREEFRKLDCDSEGYESQFSLNIPFEVNYKPIYDRLTELENQGLIYFAEPNISEKHFSEKEKKLVSKMIKNKIITPFLIIGILYAIIHLFIFINYTFINNGGGMALAGTLAFLELIIVFFILSIERIIIKGISEKTKIWIWGIWIIEIILIISILKIINLQKSPFIFINQILN